MARRYNKLSREALKMLLDGVSRREVKQYLIGKQIGARTAIAVLNRECLVADKVLPVFEKKPAIPSGLFVISPLLPLYHWTVLLWPVLQSPHGISPWL